jgi:hypothetical protein
VRGAGWAPNCCSGGIGGPSDWASAEAAKISTMHVMPMKADIKQTLRLLRSIPFI